MLKTNVGNMDRVFRVVLGAALLVAWYLLPGMSYRWVLIVLGVVALATGLMKSCPIYSVLGISTCPLKKH
tara:strand:+ start:746 stop:955 length:210 start_codon:yes stop_codon:yes gene_type:complete